MAITLRPYQNECISKIKELHAQGKNRLLVSLPTASGKSVLFSQLIKDFNTRALIVAHTHELLLQALENVKMIAPELEIGLVDGDHKEFEKHVVVSSVQSACIESNLEKLAKQNFQILIYDECHHSATDGARKILDRLGFGKNTNKLLVGFTATAYRNDAKGLKEVFDCVAYERNTKEMIDEGYLCPPVGYKIMSDLDLSKVKNIEGDFMQASLAKVMNTPELNALVVDSYIKRAHGRQTICYGVNIKHAKNLADAFNAQGIAAKAISGKTPMAERDAIIHDYKAGLIKVLCNCAVLTEGVNLPETSCIIVARPTRSRGLYQQMCGRSLRLFPNKKDAIILDFGDKNHSICSTAVLLGDDKTIEPGKERTKKDITPTLPVQLDDILRAAIVAHDPLGQSFTWEKDRNGTYFMKGANDARIEIISRGQDKYKVLFYSDGIGRVIANGLGFEWSFSSAEDFARGNRKLFALSDRDAAWRNEPISDKQKDCFKRFGFKTGIDSLTRGQAAQIIQSGVLFSKGRKSC